MALKQRKPTVSAKWLEAAASNLERNAAESLSTWIILGHANRYCEDMGKARVLRDAAGIKSIADRRTFLRAIGVDA